MKKIDRLVPSLAPNPTTNDCADWLDRRLALVCELTRRLSHDTPEDDPPPVDGALAGGLWDTLEDCRAVVALLHDDEA